MRTVVRTKRPAAAARPPVVLRGKDILVLSLSEWEGPRRIRQYLTEELLKHDNRVLFVEANFTWAKFFRTLDFGRLTRYRRGYREVKKNLFVLSAPPFVPAGEFFAGISRFNWGMTRQYIKDAARGLGFRNPILWVYAYNASSVVGTMRESQSLYFCNDAFAPLHASPYLQKKVTALEQSLVSRVDGVLTVSDKLTEEKKPFAKAIGTVYHGVDLVHFEQRLTPPPELRSVRRPILGYSGVVRHIIDLDLLDYVAVQKPEWSIAIVGPVTESGREFYAKVERLKARPNISFLGSKSAKELPPYIQQFDVCLLPYRRGVVSSYYSSPLKFYEYLAAGKPVVSTVGPYSYDKDIILNADDRDQFIAAIAKAVKHHSPAVVRKRRHLAMQNRWETRLLQIDKFFGTIASSNATR